MFSWLQFIVSLPLFFVLFFALGFILNMVLKTTWLPGVLSVFVPIAAYLAVGRLTWVDVVVFAFGILGAWTSGGVIHYLRTHGYRMY
ncbi:YuiB family protein [Hydrogenibacillus schlegelii]|uniref:YuiB family protein n=1 Tax=Hydrogenibacillus schlegelii TaxID=1484 RepID=A0A132NE44_HYDSH|nr:YuiB family protein [Hydrogenibacillus schlegelii]KWX07872.1 hypothetical protein TR75_01870 [Hydrogenibacillus schlegelii]MBT9281293.1 YuiB family protein [Hydrogenibacillus schlegelii]OAR03509.1 hypothetical protein SA87_02355 [Hydrogenibacillus schlegelii]PTQ54315.1 MAG: hypothetical protein HSCHL_0594 [Hydrogenibacillus schlegelii]